MGGGGDAGSLATLSGGFKQVSQMADLALYLACFHPKCLCHMWVGVTESWRGTCVHLRGLEG